MAHVAARGVVAVLGVGFNITTISQHPPAAVRGADRKVLIPMVGQVESFNLAAAAAIIVAETCRLAGPTKAPPPANLAADLLAQHASWHEPQRRLRRRTAAAARGEIFRQRRRADAG